ncbi:MAG: DUF3604 domain-containing protein [Oscillospiraceae bacterium]|nr:DUF3604 domain-containing protein [Oscillospiraceae bacterium]
MLKNWDCTYPFAQSEKGERIDTQNLSQRFQKITGAALIRGFGKLNDLGGGEMGTERIAGFMETHIKEEYRISQNAKNPLIFETDIVQKNQAEYTAFIFSMGFGNGSPLPAPSGAFGIYVNDVYCLSVRKINSSYYWRGESCESEFVFCMHRLETARPYESMQLSDMIKDESQAAFGIGILKVKSEILEEGKPARIKIAPVGDYKSSQYFYLSNCPNIIVGANIENAAAMLVGKNIKKSGKYNVYFGDIHTHSGQVRDVVDGARACGMGSREENYRYAKGPGGLHFYALTDHESQILPDHEKPYFDLADKYNKEGEFVCFRAYEHTSPVYGHRNIYFKTDRAKVVAAYATDTEGNAIAGPATAPHELFSRLEGMEYISIPHHPSSASHPFNIDLLTDKDVCCEVYSSWGSSEYVGDFPRGVSDRHQKLSVSEMLKRNFKLGIVAGSDGHDGHPGNAQSPLVKHPHLFHFCGSGLCAVLCDELTRENVYEAIKNRRCYATSGTPIVLNFRANGHEMGSQIQNCTKKPRLYAKCEGTYLLKEMRIVKNGKIIHAENCHELWEHEFEFVDESFEPGDKANYYIRVVQADMESAWSSPVFYGDD